MYHAVYNSTIFMCKWVCIWGEVGGQFAAFGTVVED